MSRTLLILLPILASAGCAGERGLGCEEDDRYQNTRSVAPIRVPDDLSLPDESRALRVPPPPRGAEPQFEGRCLESPPEFFEGQGGDS